MIDACLRAGDLTAQNTYRMIQALCVLRTSDEADRPNRVLRVNEPVAIPACGYVTWRWGRKTIGDWLETASPRRNTEKNQMSYGHLLRTKESRSAPFRSEDH